LQPLHWRCVECAWRITSIHSVCGANQAIIEWSWRVISVVACCHSVKLCAHAARAFRSQQYPSPFLVLALLICFSPSYVLFCCALLLVISFFLLNARHAAWTCVFSAKTKVLTGYTFSIRFAAISPHIFTPAHGTGRLNSWFANKGHFPVTKSDHFSHVNDTPQPSPAAHFADKLLTVSDVTLPIVCQTFARIRSPASQ